MFNAQGYFIQENFYSKRKKKHDNSVQLLMRDENKIIESANTPYDFYTDIAIQKSAKMKEKKRLQMVFQEEQERMRIIEEDLKSRVFQEEIENKKGPENATLSMDVVYSQKVEAPKPPRFIDKGYINQDEQEDKEDPEEEHFTQPFFTRRTFERKGFQF
jgi:hypothetical protein